MSASESLLVELLVEELPPKSLKTLGEAFAKSLFAGLADRGLATIDSVFTPYATPRRLAVHIGHVLPQADDRAITHKMMPATVALDASGAPTPALLKKLAALGATAEVVPQLERRDGTLFWASTARGATLAAGLQAAFDAALAVLPIPKVMNYQLADSWTTVHFVRPVHGLVALHGVDVVPIAAFGLASGRSTRGHRFEGQAGPIVLQHADQYAEQLEREGAVMAGFAARRAEIVRQLLQAAASQGLKPIDDEALLDEVTALVEWPNVLLCRFEPEFLAVPPECLILTMKANQKYFPLLDAAGTLTNKFLVVSNIRPEDPSAVIEGNQRVVRPRLADAKFFYDQDRKKTLESRLPLLDKVVYHGKLGSMRARVERVRVIARGLGEQLGGSALAKQADRAAQLAKADLVTDMVGEFPELQGVMGGYYARHDGESETVATAIEDHYKPRFAGDALARNEVGIVVALADKLETLAGMFSIGQTPTGDKDPFALRRHAIGVARLLMLPETKLTLVEVLDIAFDQFATPVEGAGAVADFVYERLEGMLREQGFSAVEVDSVLGQRPQWLSEVQLRVQAVRDFGSMPEAPALTAANKRVVNILRKSPALHATGYDLALFQEPAELRLADALRVVGPESERAYFEGDYTASLRVLAALKAPVDDFFDTVMVNAQEPAVRSNRLALLEQLRMAMNRVADLSKLAS